MTKLTLLSRAAATAAAALALCVADLACAGAAMAAHSHKAAANPSLVGAGENTAIHLGTPSIGSNVASSGGGASLVRTIVGLAIVIAVIWGLSWILRQVKAGRDPQLPTAGLASIAALTLSTGRSVHLVRAGSEYVLLGSAEQGLVPIHRYSEQEARDAGLLTVPEEAPRRRRQPLLTPRTEDLSRPAPARMASPATGRPDPMRMGAPGSGMVGRLREWTVRH